MKAILGIAAFSALLLACAAHADAAPARESGRIASPTLRTLSLPAGMAPLSATYTPSGKVLVSYHKPGETDPRRINLAVMDDNDGNPRTFFSQTLPARPKDNGIRYMVFADNKRIFLGDFILECAPSLDACDKSELLPVVYPAEVASGDHIAHRWSEMIVAPDNRHVAWTTLLANFSALVFTGELKREGGAYVIAQPRIVSTLDPFDKDPKHSGGVIPQVLRGGEVKQFVHGGAAISLAGARKSDIADSVVHHLASGAMETITSTPGYDETTIFSPDERLGVVMTTRFSPETDLAILGIVPRPHPDSLNMGLNMVAYTHGVTGVRRSRAGNVGPALIDVAASKREPGYRGIDLGNREDWIFHSPMSWHPSSSKALWMEGKRGPEAVASGEGTLRIRIAEMPGYRAKRAVAPRATPTALPYAVADMSAVKRYAAKGHDIDVKVYGRHSGYLTYRRTPAGRIEKTYFDYSDRKGAVYAGRETMQVNPRGRSTYTADLTLSGPNPGVMKLTMTFGPITGARPAEIVFEKDASGQPQSRGYAEIAGRRLTVDGLTP